VWLRVFDGDAIQDGRDRAKPETGAATLAARLHRDGKDQFRWSMHDLRTAPGER
jgi:hypothetical protein